MSGTPAQPAPLHLATAVGVNPPIRSFGKRYLYLKKINKIMKSLIVVALVAMFGSSLFSMGCRVNLYINSC